MKKILALMLAVIMLAGIFALPVMAEETAVALTENYGKVKIMGKEQSDGSIAFAVRSAFGESETQDVIQYFVSPRGQETSYGMENNQAFDFASKQELVSKTSSTIFSSGIKYGGDERAPVELGGFGWIGAGHGMTCAVNVIGEHDLTYENIGQIYTDKDGLKWVLLRISELKDGSSMVPSLVFVSRELKNNNPLKPSFYTLSDAHIGTDLVNVNDETNKVTISKYKNSAWLRPAYNMTTQNVYVIDGGEKTLVEADGETVYEGDYVLVEEEYTIKNPAYVAETIIADRPEDGYTENPNLAVGEDLVTFKLQHIYNPDGTVVHNWDNTFHQNVTISQFGGIQFNHNPTHIYLPNTKAFSKTAYDSAKNSLGTKTMDFSNIASTEVYPSASLGTDGWADSGFIPHRRLDFHATESNFTKVFAGGLLPVYDNVNETRLKNTDTAFFMYNSRKAYYHSIASKLNTEEETLENFNFKGSAYKKWIEDFDANGTYSYYSVPYFSDGENSRYMYFDLYQPGVTKKYDISAYLGTYSISKLEQSENLVYDIDYDTGILTVSSAENNQTSADYLVLKAKYVGESVPAVEMKIRALPTLYDVSINDKLTEIADLMESVGAEEDDYDPALIEKYNSLLSQKAAYEQAIKDEAANADRVAGLDNRYENIELSLFEDVFATDADFTTTGWYAKNVNYVVNKTATTDNFLTMKGYEPSSSSKGYPQGNNSNAFRADALNQVANLKNGVFTTTKGVPFTLGTIQTESGKMGANAFIPRAMYGAADYYTGSTAVNTIPTNIYTSDGSYQVTKAKWPVNKSGISAINMLMTGILTDSPNRFYDIYVKYEGEPSEEHNYAIAGKIDKSFEGSIKLVTKDAYNRINKNDAYGASMTKLSDMTVDDLNALTGYTPDASVTVDTSKKISKANYTTAEFNAATGFTVTASNINTYWNQCTEIKELYNNLYTNSKYQQILKENPVTLDSRSADLDLSKIMVAYTDVNVALPADSTQFVPARRFTTSQTDYNTTYVANTSIPVNSEKTVESVRLEANMTDPASMILGSGGFYSISEYNVQTGMVMLNYDGQETVTIDGTEYVMFMEVQRECGDSMLLSMNVTNQETWLDRIATVEAKMLALSAESSTYADVQAVREEITALLAQNTSIVYIKDFSEEARANIDNVEAALKATAEEQERVENLSKKVFTHVDMNKYGRDDLFATLAEFTKATGQFGYANTLKDALTGATVIEKTEGDTSYKEYYTKDNHLLAVYDIANDTYYYNEYNTNSSYKADAYTFLGNGYKFKYVPSAGEKPYYGVNSSGTETANKSVNGVYVWYHDGVGPYKEKSAVAANKAIIYGVAIPNGDSLLALLSDVKEYTAKDLITGNDVSGKTGTLTAANGTEFSFGPIAPSNSATINGILLDTEYVTIPFGEDGVKADYINLLASIYTTNNVNASFVKFTVNYENEDGSLGTKDFGIVLGKTGSKSAGIYSSTVQEVVENSIFKVEKTKAQDTFANRLANKEVASGISLDDVKFGGDVDNLIIYPSEMLNVGTMFTQHTFYPNPGESNAGVYKIPVSEFYKVKSIKVFGNFGCGDTFTKNTSDFYVEGTTQSANSVAVPVTVEGGDENYNYYGIYSPTWATRSVLYAVNTEKLPATEKIAEIEAKMAVATEKDVEEIEGLIENLTSDGSVVYPKDFNAEKVATYEALKETIDVSATVDVTKTDTKVTVKATITNLAKMTGKKYTVVVAFYDADKNLITAKINSFDTTAEKEITKDVVITDIPTGAEDVKAFVWKDLMTLKPLNK